ncbi:MAG TPA: hypothetical protein VIV11_39225 [Kofleriaceae bacterium]
MEEINAVELSQVIGGAREELPTARTTGEGNVGNMMTQSGGANAGAADGRGMRQMVGPGSPGYNGFQNYNTNMGKIGQ